MTSYMVGAATAAAFAFAAGVWAQNDSSPLGPGDAQAQIAQHSQTAPLTADTPIANVDEPQRKLTNLTVYSNGRDIGHIKNVVLDDGGSPQRIEIAFNDGQSSAWIDAAALHYDSEHRRALTALEPGEIKALEATRFR